MHNVPDLKVTLRLLKQVNPYSSLINQAAGFFETRLLISIIQEHCYESRPYNMHVVNVDYLTYQQSEVYRFPFSDIDWKPRGPWKIICICFVECFPSWRMEIRNNTTFQIHMSHHCCSSKKPIIIQSLPGLQCL